jgi:hypothetical protein
MRTVKSSYLTKGILRFLHCLKSLHIKDFMTNKTQFTDVTVTL